MNIKEELIDQTFPDLVLEVQEETEAGNEHPSNSLTQNLDTNSQFVHQIASNVEMASGDDPSNPLSHENYVPSKMEPTQERSFQSVKVQQGSRTPYSDATNVPHDAQKTKRPMNAFMVFAHYERKKILQGQSNTHNAVISRTLGKRWKEMPAEAKYPYLQEAERLRQFHLIQYPDYKYKPNRPKKNAKPSDSFLSRRNLPSQSLFALARSGQCSFKISNCFGSNSWVNSPVSELCNGRTQLINVDIAKLGFKLIVDSNFKKTLKNPRNHRDSRKKVPVKASAPPTSTSSYHSPGISYASNASLPSSDTLSLNKVQNSSVEPAYEVDNSDIHDIIEEFMMIEPSTPSNTNHQPSLQNQEQFDNKWYQQQKIYQQQQQQQHQNQLLLQQQPSNTNPQPPLQNEQQFDNKWYQQQKIYQQQQQHQNQLLWQQQQFRYQNHQTNNTIF